MENQKNTGRKILKTAGYVAVAAGLIFVGSRYAHRNGLQTVRTDVSNVGSKVRGIFSKNAR